MMINEEPLNFNDFMELTCSVADNTMSYENWLKQFHYELSVIKPIPKKFRYFITKDLETNQTMQAVLLGAYQAHIRYAEHGTPKVMAAKILSHYKRHKEELGFTS